MKLTKSIKERIISAVYKKKIQPLKDDIEQKLKTQTKAYIDFKTKKHRKFVESAPERWLYYKSNFEVSFGKSFSETFYVNLEDVQAVPFAWSQGGRSAYLKVEEKEWIDIFSDIKKEEISNDKYSRELMAELRGFLSGVNTDKQLLENFPEVADFIDLNEFKFYAPVVQTEKLKKLLQEG